MPAPASRGCCERPGARKPSAQVQSLPGAAGSMHLHLGQGLPQHKSPRGPTGQRLPEHSVPAVRLLATPCSLRFTLDPSRTLGFGFGRGAGGGVCDRVAPVPKRSHSLSQIYAGSIQSGESLRPPALWWATHQPATLLLGRTQLGKLEELWGINAHVVSFPCWLL